MSKLELVEVASKDETYLTPKTQCNTRTGETRSLLLKTIHRCDLVRAKVFWGKVR